MGPRATETCAAMLPSFRMFIAFSAHKANCVSIALSCDQESEQIPRRSIPLHPPLYGARRRNQRCRRRARQGSLRLFEPRDFPEVVIQPENSYLFRKSWDHKETVITHSDVQPARQLRSQFSTVHLRNWNRGVTVFSERHEA